MLWTCTISEMGVLVCLSAISGNWREGSWEDLGASVMLFGTTCLFLSVLSGIGDALTWDHVSFVLLRAFFLLRFVFVRAAEHYDTRSITKTTIAISISFFTSATSASPSLCSSHVPCIRSI